MYGTYHKTSDTETERTDGSDQKPVDGDNTGDNSGKSYDETTPPNQTPVENVKPPINTQAEKREMADQVTIHPFVYRGNASTLGQRFEEWLELFDLANSILGYKDEKLKAFFILKLGDELRAIYRANKNPSKDSYTEIRTMLTTHLKPKTVLFTEVMVFRRAQRQEGESANEFATRLRSMARNCEFGEWVEREILQQFIVGIWRSDIYSRLVGWGPSRTTTLTASTKGLRGTTVS